ncbi:hypothetical protein GGX14DRAFT_612964 [Mycena pura]|uniref:Uncharacterized protein n=1 Tax=Mycena pura TaxID=153505 RepID=A0AAD6YT80_9AGAR|nr:hypothetical protein GGX14DRAFT_612964 [Mycena pura]
MPKASSALRMRRPGPLKELPLDSFLPPDPNLPQRPNKRSHSPSPSLFSPTKRRILAEEGIIIGGGSVRSPARLRALPVSRDRGSESPVKKHDGGPHKNSVASARSPPSASYIAIELQTTRLTRRQTRHSASLPTVDASLHRYEDDSSLLTEDTSSRSARVAPVQIPRDIPPPVDPRSIHYPGFQVHQDPYVFVGPAVALEADSPLSPEKDTLKENVPPRRKARKSNAAFDLKAHIVSSDAKATPRTPGKLFTRERSTSATPTACRPDNVLTWDTRLTPKLGDRERREMRRQLAHEVDAIPSEDEETL